jgi:hypothetical protein
VKYYLRFKRWGERENGRRGDGEMGRKCLSERDFSILLEYTCGLRFNYLNTKDDILYFIQK